MEWVDQLYHKVVAVDTAPLIYFIEEHPSYAGQLSAFFEAVDRGYIQVVTSVVTLVEVLARPLRERQLTLVDRYKEILLASTGFDTLPVSIEVAEQSARLRATYGLRTPDAIQPATAMNAGATVFLTNDIRFVRVSQLQVLVVSELRGG